MGASLSLAMAISTPILLLILPVLASTLQQGDLPDNPRPRIGALQRDQGIHGGLQGSETRFVDPGSDWPHHLQSKRYWQTLVGNLFPNRFGKITKREMLEEQDKDGLRKKDNEKMKEKEEKMREKEDEENMRKKEEQRIVETIRILQGVLLRGRKYSRFA